MEPQIVGMYVLLVSGLFPVVAMIVWMFRKDGPTVLSVVLVFLGFGMIGVGAFGPTFLGDYVQLVNALRDVERAATTEQQAEAASSIIQQYANGNFNDEDWSIISATLKENPVPGLDQMLERGASRAPLSRREAMTGTFEDIQRLETGLLGLAWESPGTMTETDSDADPFTTGTLELLDDRRLRFLKTRPDWLREQQIDPRAIDLILERRDRIPHGPG